MVSVGAPLDRLRASGDIIPARRTLDDLPPPLALSPGQEPPSAVLARLRSDERWARHLPRFVGHKCNVTLCQRPDHLQLLSRPAIRKSAGSGSGN